MSEAQADTYTPGLAEETLHPSEEIFIETLKKLTMDRLRGQYPPGSTSIQRDAHPKTHGLVTAEFIVLDDFSYALRHGVFKTPRKFDALIRFSAGDVFSYPDTRLPRSGGMAIKLLGVEGEKLLASERHALTQDFIMINFPGFLARSFESYEALHIASAPEDRARFYEAHRPEHALYLRQSLEPFYNPLQVRYFSQVPYMLGPNAIKFSAKPIFNTANRPPASEGPDFLREAMRKQVVESDVYFDFMVQVQTDPVRMPIEEPLTVWDESQSPFQRVAIVRIPRQDITMKGIEMAETLAFNPWHALPEHRPIGNMNRARRVVYEMVSEYRRTANGVVRAEPTSLPQ
ncbi:hypothetical protein [Mesorhizobium sp. M0772]|uniref:hypothetical protein n=1 Tax=Mesorhizobium sp. M0772 TaxID=2956998 RepID=UPI00333DEF3F